MHRKYRKLVSAGLVLTMAGAMMLQGCGQKKETGKTEIELVQYKPEAVKTFEKIEEEFNRTHDDIHLTIESPNDAMTVLKTRFIREDKPGVCSGKGNLCSPVCGKCSRNSLQQSNVRRTWMEDSDNME